MNKIDIEHLEVEEHISATFTVSLEGEMPEGEKERFDIAPAATDAGECFSVASCEGDMSFKPGCEQLIYQLCLVVHAGVVTLVEVVARKFRTYCERAKMTVCRCTPEFLRL